LSVSVGLSRWYLTRLDSASDGHRPSVPHVHWARPVFSPPGIVSSWLSFKGRNPFLLSAKLSDRHLTFFRQERFFFRGITMQGM